MTPVNGCLEATQVVLKRQKHFLKVLGTKFMSSSWWVQIRNATYVFI